MKPREFDELVRQKFDRNDFEYNPRNWDMLEEQLDGRAKKRSMLMWWLMPVAGIAASVALAMGIPSLLQHSGVTGAGESAVVADAHTPGKAHIVVPARDLNNNMNIVSAQNDAANTTNNAPQKTHNRPVANHKEHEVKEEVFAINYFNAVRNTQTTRKVKINLLGNIPGKTTVTEKHEERSFASNEPVNTFKPEAERKQPKLSVMVSGGYNMGSQNTGYVAGAAIRKKVSDKVFVEGNMAYASNNIAQDMPYRDSRVVTHYWQNGHEIAPPTSAGKTSAVGDAAGREITTTQTTEYSKVKYNHVNYALSYVELHPSIGYKLMKKVSVGVGPDFQQVLADNRPDASETNPGVNQKAPLFDMGLIGKTEISLTRTVKAGVSYRKGINNILTPMNKFVDRDYMQFEVKCAIFNK